MEARILRACHNGFRERGSGSEKKEQELYSKIGELQVQLDF
ncbi:hypothetical protein [Leadbetterella byssophila]